MRYVVGFLLALFVFTSCTENDIRSISRENLFTLDIGRLEDQIDLINLEGEPSIEKTRITMRDGLFYISDGKGERVTRYTSYGDLLFMIYNEENNPPPLTLPVNPEEGEQVTRWASVYPFREPGEIRVDSRKHIYVEDRLPTERHAFDQESRALLDSTVLHFDTDGKFIEYLGREGLGGSPFPRISSIHATVNDEIAVVCRLPGGWNIYWFNAEGTLLYSIPISSSTLPVLPDQELFPSVDSVSIAPDERKVHIKIDYYESTFDASTGTQTGITFDSSVIWVMSVESGIYESIIEIPLFEETFSEGNREYKESLIYSMVGVVKNGWVFLSVPVDGGYSLLVVREKSPEQRRGFIQVDNDELYFNAFDVSSDGILSGLLADDWQAKIVWWRSDSLIGDIVP
ncbi:MAG: hypothetical protein LBV20_05435 [Treponema sp.]|jgi:hypothetical protein|nr:hypothetical protein [Treponema sp.]